jgi:putative DNA primase/helicase
MDSREQEVLASLMRSTPSRAKWLPRMSPEMFRDPGAAEAFRAIRSAHNKGMDANSANCFALLVEGVGAKRAAPYLEFLKQCEEYHVVERFAVDAADTYIPELGAAWADRIEFMAENERDALKRCGYGPDQLIEHEKRTDAKAKKARAIEPPAPARNDDLDEADTDLAASHRLVVRHSQHLRYCGEREAWYVWDGKRWAMDVDHRVEYLAGETARAYTAARINGDPKELAKAKRMESRQRISGAILQSRSHPSVSIRAEAFDSHHDLLTVANGVVDLRTGELRPHDPTLLMTSLVDVDYDPTADAPRFMAFLREIHPGKPEITEFLWRWLGYCLTGHVTEQALVLAVGEGRNGKGTLFEAFGRVLGLGLSAQAPPGLLMSHKGDRHPADMMALRGKRYVYASEVEGGQTFSEERLKFLTGGDTITARGMRENFTTFRPTHKLVLYVNDLPKVKDVSHAFWRRMRVVPFDERFDGDRLDRDLPEKLDAESVGILAWGVRGAVAWYRDGLPVPAEVAAAARAYRSEQDDIGRWIADQLLDVTSDREQLASEHHRSYTRWAEANSGAEYSLKAFSDQLAKHKCAKRKTKRGTTYTLPVASDGGDGSIHGCSVLDSARLSCMTETVARARTRAIGVEPETTSTIEHPPPLATDSEKDECLPF